MRYRHAVAAMLLVSGCYDPPQPLCGFRCGPSGACPVDYACNASDGYCHRAGAPAELTCPLVDAGVDAADFFPRIVETVPADDADEVPHDVIVGVKFTEQVVGVSEETFTLARQDLGVPLAARVTYDASTRRATLVPDEPLAASRRYVASLAAEIADASGQPIVGQTSWMFKTAADITPPQVAMTMPAAGATGVPVDVLVVATFTEQVSHVTLGSFLLEAPGGFVTGTIVYVSQTAVGFKPAVQLAPFTVHTATLTSAITDFAQNVLEGAPVTWSFTTGADTIPPTIKTRSPEIDDFEVATSAKVSVGFSEPVVGVSAESVTLELAGQPVAATVSYSETTSTARLTPDVPLALDATYTVRLSAQIRDRGGNPLVGAPVTWSFQTVSSR
jgi:hypothetical protein